MKISEQLTNIYHKFESWHKKKLSIEESNQYHEKLLMQGNIITIIEDEELKAYIEVWRINHEQLGRIVCDIPFFVYDENIVNGQIAYIANMWIDEMYRETIINQKLVQNFINKFGDCDFVVGKKTNRHNNFRAYSMKQIKGV